MEFKRFALAMVGHFLSSLLYVLRRLHIVNAIVDTSSILEHREELRELWEKRMMADDNQSSPSSTVADKKDDVTEEGPEEKVVKTKGQTETSPEHKVTNGFAHPVENKSEDGDGHHEHTQEAATQETEKESEIKLEEEQDKNKAARSLEADNSDDYVEEKTYTSEFETSLVMKQITEIVTEAVVKTTMIQESSSNVNETIVETVTEHIVTSSVTDTDKSFEEAKPSLSNFEEANGNKTVETETTALIDFADEPSSSDTNVKEIDAQHNIEETVSTYEEVLVSISADSKQQLTQENESAESVTDDKQVKNTESDNKSADEIDVGVSDSLTNENTELSNKDKPLADLEIDIKETEDGDGFVRLEECLPQTEEQIMQSAQENSAENDAVITDTSILMTNGGDQDPSEPPSPPEMEAFVKSGGLKRLVSGGGVQKTEPYSACTTETKIAMEIREMREREEELRVMREQQVVSPLPPPSKSPTPRDTPLRLASPVSPTPSSGPGYRVSSVFGTRASPSPPNSVFGGDDRKLPWGGLAPKESAVEKEIRLARDREEELRKQKGLPPREDDSYVKPSQVKSSQVRVFGKMVGSSSAVKQAATAKIQLEIEEQTQREMALRDTGSIQTISQERTDAKVAKLKTTETPPATNGNLNSLNGNFTNGRSSPDTGHKRASPSPTGPRPATIFSQSNGKGISMAKFIASKGKESTFSAPRSNGSFTLPREESRVGSVAVPPSVVKPKRNLSVESKIQQEIMEMKQREEELKMLHLNKENGELEENGNGIELELNLKNNFEYDNGINDEDLSPRHNKLIAQWEQRIQKAES